MKPRLHLLIALTLLIGLHHASAKVSFAPATNYVVGLYPWSVVATNVNGDDEVDLICANAGNGTLTVLTNNGSGGFVLALSPDVSHDPYSVTAADVNGDGIIDLISANSGSGGNILSVLTNTGSGGFVLCSSPGVDTNPVSVVAADVNGDGKMDLISANANANTLSVLTNNGKGVFSLSSAPSVGHQPESVTATDVNGDGKMDLICANFNDNTLTVLTNDGSGGFVLASSPGVGNRPISVTAADVKGDGKMDLICANYFTNTLTVLTNKGGGSFTLASSPGVGNFPTSVTAADVNGDGKVDLACANLNFGTATLSILTNNWNGGFGSNVTYTVGSNARSVIAADVNRDGNVDLICANFQTNTLSVFINTSVFPPPLIWPKLPSAILLPLGPGTNLIISVIAGSSFRCQWFFNGVSITNATNTSLTVTNFDLTKAGAYSVTVSNQYGYDTAVSVLRLTNSPVVLVDGVDVGGGSVTRVASAQISMSSTFGGNIYYTLDGSAPDFLSIPYHGIFHLTQTTTIRALAYDSAYVSSAEAAPITVQIVPIYKLTSSTPGGGSMSVSPAPYSGSNLFLGNTTVTITATPSNGWSFLGWLGDAAGLNPMATLTMTRDMTVQALFGTAVTSNALGAGQIWFGRQVPLYPYGTTLAVAAIPQTGSYLINWAGALSGSNNPNVLVVTSPNPIITALFGSLSAGRYALTVLPQGAGSVTVSPYTNRYASGTVVTVTAVPGSGQTFTGWSGDASGTQNPLTLTMTQSKVIAANFTSRPALSTTPPLNRMAEQGFRFSLTGELGIASRIDGSSDLSNWIPLGWLTNDFGTSQFLDPAALTNAAQFYRAVTQ
jgi:hypothetical protein